MARKTAKKSTARKSVRRGGSKTSRSAAAKKGWKTRRAKSTKRSNAARKGWETRRVKSTKRSNAAKITAHSRKSPKKELPKKGGKFSGVIYAIIHPMWPGWVKLGMSIITGKSIETRYNTSYPDRGCKLIEQVWVSSRSKAEKELHNLAEEKSSKRDHEWFKISQKEAIKLMKKVENKY